MRTEQLETLENQVSQPFCDLLSFWQSLWLCKGEWFLILAYGSSGKSIYCSQRRAGYG